MTAPKAYYVGLDVAVKRTQVCIMDQSMEIVAEAKIDTDPEDIAHPSEEYEPEERLVEMPLFNERTPA